MGNLRMTSRLFACLAAAATLAAPVSAHGPSFGDLAAYGAYAVVIGIVGIGLAVATVYGQYRVLLRLFRMKTGLAWLMAFHFAYGYVGIFLYRDMLLGGIIGSALAVSWVAIPALHSIIEWEYALRKRYGPPAWDRIPGLPPMPGAPGGKGAARPRKEKSPLEI